MKNILRYFVLMISLLGSVRTATPDQCSYCNVITNLQNKTPLTGLLYGIPTSTYPVYVFVGTNPEGIEIIVCKDPYCLSNALVQKQQNSIDAVKSAPLSNGEYVMLSHVSSSQSATYQLCTSQDCTQYSTTQVTWSNPSSAISVAVPPGTNTPVLLGAVQSTSSLEFQLCTTLTCTAYTKASVNATFASTVQDASFTIDGTGNYVVMIHLKSSVEMVFCLNGAKECVQSRLYSGTSSQVFAVSPPSAAYPSGSSIAAVGYCTGTGPGTIIFCQNTYCTQYSTATFGQSPSIASVSFGPDNLAVISYIEKDQAVYITHCFDYLCTQSMAPYMIINIKMAGVASVLTGSSITILAIEAPTTSVALSTVFCGPFITSMSPTKAVIGQQTTVTFEGHFCSASAGYCTFGSQTAVATSKTETEVTCSVTYATPTQVPATLGNSAMTEYSTFNTTFSFYSNASPSTSPTASVTPSTTPSASPSITPSVTPSISPSKSVTPTSSASASVSSSPVPSSSATPSVTPSPSSSASSSTIPSKSPTPSASFVPSAPATSTPTASMVPSPSPSISPSASPIASPTSPSDSPSPSAFSSPSPSSSTTDDNDSKATTVISIMMTAFFAVSTITTYSYFKWGKPRDYEATPIRFTYDNIVTLVAIPVDLVQLCAFSTNIKAEWAQLIYQACKTSIFEVPEGAYLPLFWIACTATALWCLYVLPFYVRVPWGGSRVPLVEYLQKTRRIFRTIYYPAPLILIPFGSVFFFAICNVLLQMVSCDYQDGSHLTMDSGIVCWQGKHLWWSLMTMSVFFLYFPLALHLMPKLQQASKDLDIKYNEKFLFIVGILKLIICVIHALFQSWQLPRLTTVAAVTLVITLVNMEMEPCNIYRINSVRTAVYFSACVCAVCSAVATFASDHNLVPLFVLISCWGVILVFVILAQLGFVHSFIRRKNYELLEAIHTEE